MEWHDTIFAGQYEKFTEPLFSCEENQREAEFIASALHLKHTDSILDVACGFGRHANLLAAMGFRVTGIDRYEQFLTRAKKSAPDDNTRFLQRDMRQLGFQKEFTAAYSFFSSFGYFDDKTNFSVLRQMAAALKPGGRLLIDLQNRELYATGEPLYQEFIEFNLEGEPAALLMTSTFSPHTGRVSITQRLHWKGEAETMRFSVRLYSLAELKWLLTQAGLELVRSYGNADGSEYEMDSDRLIITARRNV